MNIRTYALYMCVYCAYIICQTSLNTFFLLFVSRLCLLDEALSAQKESLYYNYVHIYI